MATFSLTSCNARWGLDVHDRPFDLAAAVRGFDSDIVSLQEVWVPSDGPNPVAEVAAELGYHLTHTPLSGSWVEPRPEITSDPALAQGTWGVVLLSRLPVRAVRIVDLGRLVERWDVATRRAVIAEIDVAGIAVSVTALHLSFVLPNAAAQLRRLSGYLPGHQPSVVAGDCNLWGPVAAQLVHRHRRAVTGRTWPAHRPHSQLDHVLVSPEVTVVSSGVLAPVGSDHLPVGAVLDVDQRGH